jgi:hypothetical protein
MEVVFEGPWFSSEEDEDQFFESLYSLPQYSKVVGKGTKLYLELKSPIEKETVLGLLRTFKHWKIETNPSETLKPLLPESELWNL